MSRALETLARLQRAQIDEVRITLGEIVEARAAVAARDGARVTEMTQEAALAALTPEDSPAFGTYAGRILAERQGLAREDAELALREEALRERMREAFQELKKVEHLIATQSERERMAENARELSAMDEAGIMRAARKS